MSYASGFMLGASIGKAIHNMVSGGGFSPAGGRGKGMGKQAANPPYAAPAMPAAPVRPNIPAFACVSSTRGRRRYRAAALVQNQPLAELLQQALGSLPAARRVEVNAATGSILVCSDNEGALDALERYLGERIFPAVPAPPYVPAPVQTKTAASAYTDVLYETLNFLNSAVSQKTANVFDLRSLLSLFLAVRGMRKMIGQNQRPSGPQMLWWATSLMRGGDKMYTCCTLPLHSVLPLRMRSILSVKLRQIPGVAAASSDEQKLTIYYQGKVDLRIIRMLVRSFEQKYGKAKEDKKEWDVAAYRREAIISVGGFIAMNILRKTNPEFYDGILLFRRLFTLFIARRFIQNGVMGVIRDKQANADTLTATAVAASVLAGKPESSLTLLALSNGAEMLTEYAAERARRQISGLLKLDQRDVWLVENGRERKVPVDSLKVGDTIAVHLGEKICVDGKVVGGNAAVNQASITGESNPAIKQPGTFVYAGSVIEAGDLVVKVEKVGADTSLAQIIHLVEEAQTRRAPVQNFADKMANMLVPISFIGAAIVYGATKDWQRVLNLLFIDFSCGLKLSTATAISAAIGMAARKGILIKGGNYIENLADIDTVVLDKTGTITMGVPQIAHISTVPGVGEKEMILLAASAEMHSVHPLAVAVQKYVKAHGWDVPHHDMSETVVARGMRASVPPFEDFAGGDVLVGSRRFMQEEGVQGMPEKSDKSWGKNLLFVARDKQYIGCLTIEDPVRPAMKKTLNQMRRIGVDEVIMLTGDSKEVAAEVAREMDIDSYHAEILPEDKANYVMKLQKRGSVMMVGDGINDAPALAFADIGVSLGGNKTDIAAESAAITIRSEDPGKLYDALKIGRQTMKVINQNFTATIVVNSAAMLLGALGRISPLWAAVIHNTATLAVVLNSVRILGVSRRMVKA